MIYHEIMQKVKELPGWTWEWKRWDLAYNPTLKSMIPSIKDGDFILVAQSDYGEGDEVVASNRDDCHSYVTWLGSLIPLPSIEQWMEKFRISSVDLIIHAQDDGSIIVDTTDKNIINYQQRSTNILKTLSLLYARVVLGYKFNGKEFGSV